MPPVIKNLMVFAAACAGIIAASAARADLAPDAPLDDPLTCLARAVYFEARGASEQEMTAVAWVIRNRAEDPEFPSTICGVVREGGEKAPCQFGWWCDGRPDVVRNERVYAKIATLARAVLAGDAEDPTRGANMFHGARRKPPSWTASAEGRGRIGSHLFYFLDER